MYLAGGVEVMSRLPYSIDGSRSPNRCARWRSSRRSGPSCRPRARTSRSATRWSRASPIPSSTSTWPPPPRSAPQMYGVDRAEQDEYARESFRRTLAGWNSGFYGTHVVPVVARRHDRPREGRVPLPARGPRRQAADVRQGPAAFDNSAYPMKNFYGDFGRSSRKDYQEGDEGHRHLVQLLRPLRRRLPPSS